MSARLPRVIAALTALMLFSVPFWAAFGQLGNVLNLWLLDATDRSFFGLFELQATIFQSVEPLVVLALTPVVIALWARLRTRDHEPSALIKMAAGCLFLATGYAVLALATQSTDPGMRVSWLWTLGYLSLLAMGDLLFVPTSWALFSRLAPRGMESSIMGLWYLSLFAGSYLAGLLGTLWGPLERVSFWLLICSVAMAGGMGILLVERLIRRHLETQPARMQGQEA